MLSTPWQWKPWNGDGGVRASYKHQLNEHSKLEAVITSNITYNGLLRTVHNSEGESRSYKDVHKDKGIRN